MQKTIKSDVYGKVIYKNHSLRKKEKIAFFINGKMQEIKCEIDIFSVIYEEKKMGLLDEEHIQFYDENSILVNEKKAMQIEQFQKDLYEKVILKGKEELCKKIEEAALREREVRLQGQTEKNFSKIVGRKNAHNCFCAETREEKLVSLELKKMRIMQDYMEITCKCDWFRPSGGFIIDQNGDVKMLHLSCMNI